MERRHQGVAKGHEVALLEGGLTYKQTGISQRDMEFLEGRKYNREEVMAVYKVPKSELGLYEQINFATAKTMDRVFWTKTLIPRMLLYENILWTQFLSKLAGPEIWAEFDRTAIDPLKDRIPAFQPGAGGSSQTPAPSAAAPAPPEKATEFPLSRAPGTARPGGVDKNSWLPASCSKKNRVWKILPLDNQVVDSYLSSFAKSGIGPSVICISKSLEGFKENAI